MTTLQSFLTPVCGTSATATRRKSPTELAVMYLRDRGYSPAQIDASHHDASVLTPEDTASMHRILWGPAPTPAPGPVKVDCYEWSIEVLDDPHACPRLRSIAVALRNEDQITGQTFVPPVMTSRESAERDERVAAAAVATGTASELPTTVGVGLTYDERRTVNQAIIRATDASTTEYPFAAGERAGEVALRSVLAERTRIEPEPVDPWDIESDPADWPADTDAYTWGLTDPLPGDDEDFGGLDPAFKTLDQWDALRAEEAACTPPLPYDLDHEPTHAERVYWASEGRCNLFDAELDRRADEAFAEALLEAGLLCFPAISGGSPTPDETPVKVYGARNRPVLGWTDADQYRHHGAV